MKNKILIFIIFFSVLSIADAAKKAAPTDTLRVYKLGLISVNKDKVHKITTRSKLEEVKYFHIQNADIQSMSEIERLIPSGKVRTNSRGESMLFIRGAGERQLGLFFDGVQMNIPWDNRLDLKFVPADVIGSIDINKGANSILYGANVLGGAVSISSLERSNDGFGASIKLQGGTAGSQLYSILHDGKIGNFNYITNYSYHSSDGFSLSKDAPDDRLFQTGELRTNTDIKRHNFYVRGEYQFSELTVFGASLMHTKSEQGVAPLMDARAGKKRFWRYPDRNRTIISLNGQHTFLKESDLTIKTTLWFDTFNQKLENYKSSNYTTLKGVMNDKDVTLGTRISLNYDIDDNNSLTYVFNGLQSSHTQQEDQGQDLDFEQQTVSTGLEYRLTVATFDFNTGFTYDYNTMPKTGNFKEQEGSSDNALGSFLAMNYRFTDDMGVFANVSRRTRFATMRESFDGALGKFIPNPDLKPETGVLTELGTIINYKNLEIKLTGFYNSYVDLIDQVKVEGVKKRVNFADANIYGGEISLFYRLKRLSLQSSITFLQTRAKQNGKDVDHLDNKPELLANFIANYKFKSGFSTAVEVECTGNQYEYIDDSYVKINSTALLNAKVAYTFTFIPHVIADVYVRANNIFDTYRLSQIGYPETGRMIYCGISTKI